MNKIEVIVPDNVQAINNAANGIIACSIMLLCGIVSGALAAIKYLFGGVFRVAAGAVAGGCAAAKSSN